MKNKVLWLVIIVQVVAIVSLAKGLIDNRRMAMVIKDMERRKQVLEDRKRKLKEELKKVNSPEYIEWVAREKLHLVKPGEVMVIGE